MTHLTLKLKNFTAIFNLNISVQRISALNNNMLTSQSMRYVLPPSLLTCWDIFSPLKTFPWWGEGHTETGEVKATRGCTSHTNFQHQDWRWSLGKSVIWDGLPSNLTDLREGRLKVFFPLDPCSIVARVWTESRRINTFPFWTLHDLFSCATIFT